MNENEKIWGQKIMECVAPQNEQESHKEARKALTGNGYKLFSYLCDMARINDRMTVFPLSADDVAEYTGMGRHSYWIAVNELIEKGFICRTDKRTYFFDGTRKQ